jgi:hypothetical protein
MHDAAEHPIFSWSGMIVRTETDSLKATAISKMDAAASQKDSALSLAHNLAASL